MTGTLTTTDAALLAEVRDELLAGVKPSEIARRHSLRADVAAAMTRDALDTLDEFRVLKLSLMRLADLEDKLAATFADGDFQGKDAKLYLEAIRANIHAANDTFATYSSMLTRLNDNQVREIVTLIEGVVFPVIDRHLDDEGAAACKRDIIDGLEACDGTDDAR